MSVASSQQMPGSIARRVLVIAYSFPPSGDVGVHRTRRFVKCLPSFGWHPIVLAPRAGRYAHIDTSLANQLPESLDVRRSYSFEALNYGTTGNGSGRAPTGWFQQALKDLWRFATVPDDKIGWIPWAVREGSRIIEGEGIDAIYVTGKPFSSYIIGHELSRRHSVPWLMDLRDLWTLNPRQEIKGAVRRQLHRRLESFLIDSAAVVIANTPGDRERFIEAYPAVPATKFVAITNGFDRSEFPEPVPVKYERFTVAYAGAFYFSDPDRVSAYRKIVGTAERKDEIFETYSPAYLLEAVSELFTERPELREHVQLAFSGSGCAKVAAVLPRFGLEKNVTLHGWLDYADSLNVLRRSHLLALVLSRGDESRTWIPSKLYQYLGAGTPILGLLPDGDAADIVRITSAGTVVAPDDKAGMKRAIANAYDTFAAGALPVSADRAAVDRYEATYLTGLLVDCLERSRRSADG